jgi:1-acyl-sn-glycerol-3-phosphate acyltransferase
MIKKLKKLFYFSHLSYFIFSISMPVVCFFIRLKYKVKVEYLFEKPDPRTNYLIVSNHRSNLDPPIISSFMNMPMAFIAKKELFTNPVFSFLISLYSAILIDRENTQKSTFDLTRQALKTKRFNGAWNSSIFIEGTRSKDPQYLGKPNNGAIFIAKLNKVPILPVGISYSEKEITIKVGQAYELDRKKELEDSAWECLEKISKLCQYKLPERH